MSNPEQIRKTQDVKNEVPTYGVKEYLERASNYYYKQDNPKEEAVL